MENQANESAKALILKVQELLKFNDEDIFIHFCLICTEVNNFRNNYSTLDLQLAGKGKTWYRKQDQRRTEALKGLEDFEWLLLTFSFSPYGINRSKGVTTLNDVYLGNICGIWTNNLSTFNKVEPEVKKIIINQARNILRGILSLNTNWLK